MKQTTLKAQALQRWNSLPYPEQKTLREELAERPPGTACIELDEIKQISNWPDPYRTGSKGRVVAIVWGMDASQRDKRYLFKSDIPEEPE